MENINSIEWLYKPTPERIKQASKVRGILAKVFYLLMIPYAIGAYLQYMNDKETGIIFATIIIVVYISGLLFWHLVLSKKMVPKEKAYTANNEGVKILEINSNKSREYKWDLFEFFSKETKVLNNTEEKWAGMFLSLKEKKKDAINFVFLELNYSDLEKVVSFLGQKLPEKELDMKNFT